MEESKAIDDLKEVRENAEKARRDNSQELTELKRSQEAVSSAGGEHNDNNLSPPDASERSQKTSSEKRGGK